jgi:hypothetical protein
LAKRISACIENSQWYALIVAKKSQQTKSSPRRGNPKRVTWDYAESRLNQAQATADADVLGLGDPNDILSMDVPTYAAWRGWELSDSNPVKGVEKMAQGPTRDDLLDENDDLKELLTDIRDGNIPLAEIPDAIDEALFGPEEEGGADEDDG